jgi:hypothetical protein
MSNPSFTGIESSLSPYAGPYVSEMLGKGVALASLPYEAYGGPLTAGQSDLQDTAFQGLAGLSVPTSMGGFNPMSFTGAGYAAPTAQQAADGQMGAYTPASGDVMQQYMTPYLQGALQPQYDAAQTGNQRYKLKTSKASTAKQVPTAGLVRVLQKLSCSVGC